MKNAQKPDHISLANIVTRLREGRYVIPDFQRDFEWQPSDISALMRSIFRDYYIGSLLLWKGKNANFEALACEPVYGFAGKGERTHIVLDGQQRLTAMYYAFIAPDEPAPRRRNRYLYFIRVDRFMDESYDDAFEYDWTRRGLNLLQDETQQFETHMFPLAVVGQSGWALANWVQGYEKHWRDAAQNGNGADRQTAERHATNAKEFGIHLKDVTEEFQISFIEMDQDLEIDKVCDIFTQINSRGVRLDVFDLMNALLRPKGLQLRRQLWRSVAARLEFVDSRRMNVYVLQVMSILRQGYCSPRYLYYLLPGNPRQIRGQDGIVRPQVLVADTTEFENRWCDAVEALERAIDLLRHPQEFGAIHSNYVPYVSILPVFASLQAKANRLAPDQRLNAQRKIRFWYWASVFANRYSGSVESTSARDYFDVTAWFAKDDAEPGLIGDFRSNFKGLELTRETRRGTSVYNGIFNLLVLRGARDWVTGNVPQHGELDDHHIVPKSWSRQRRLRTPIDTILNRSPLTAETNREIIRDHLPNEYLPELIEANGESEVLDILESHYISQKAFEILMKDPFTADDFEDFCNERRRAFMEGIESLLVKERLDLSLPLRELDAGVEAVELGLRQLVTEGLGGNVDRLPSNIRETINQRIHTATNRNPALDADHYETVTGKLEFSDLRELQDIVTNKGLWPLFETKFGDKNILVNRFQQLIGLRNGIRHSRTVDEITRKEGEAAILWFEQILD